MRREHTELEKGTVCKGTGLGHMAQACRGAIRKATAQENGSKAPRRGSKPRSAVKLDKENVSQWGGGFTDC